jgi:hypothetical protein
MPNSYRFRRIDATGPSSILTICALKVGVDFSADCCSIRNSWNTAGEALNASTNGDTSSDLTQIQKHRGDRALLYAFQTHQMDGYFAGARSHVLLIVFIIWAGGYNRRPKIQIPGLRIRHPAYTTPSPPRAQSKRPALECSVRFSGF